MLCVMISGGTTFQEVLPVISPLKFIASSFRCDLEHFPFRSPTILPMSMCFSAALNFAGRYAMENPEG